MTSNLIFQFAGGNPVSWLSPELSQVDKDDIREMILQTTYARSLLMQLYDDKEPTPELKSYWQILSDNRNTYSAYQEDQFQALKSRIQTCMTKYQTSHPLVNPAALLPELLLRFVGPSQFLLMILSDIKVDQLTPEDAAGLFKTIWERSAELYCKNLDLQIVATKRKGDLIRRFAPSTSSLRIVASSHRLATSASLARVIEPRDGSDLASGSDTHETPPPPYHSASELGTDKREMANLHLGHATSTQAEDAFPTTPSSISGLCLDTDADADADAEADARADANTNADVASAAEGATMDEICFGDYLDFDADSPASTGPGSGESADPGGSSDSDPTHDSAGRSSSSQNGGGTIMSSSSVYSDDIRNESEPSEVCISPQMSDVEVLGHSSQQAENGGPEDRRQEDASEASEAAGDCNTCSSDFEMVDADDISDTCTDPPIDANDDAVGVETQRRLPKVKAERLREDFIGLVEQMLRMPDFEGIFKIEDLPEVDWARLKEEAPSGPLSTESYYTAVQWSHFDNIEGLAKLHNASSGTSRKFDLPVYKCTDGCQTASLRPTVEGAERMLDSLCVKPDKRTNPRDQASGQDHPCKRVPEHEIQYVVGPAMTDEYEGLLSCGVQLDKEAVGEQRGINTLYTMMGEHFSGTSLHIEDGRFWSCNINLHGYKIWTCIEPEAKDALESAIKTAFASSSHASLRRGRSRIRATCDQFVRHHSLVASPAWLRANGIPFKILCAGPGEAVITRPNQYHSVVNVGKAYSCAMNFVMPGQDPFPADVQTCEECGLHSIMQDIQARRPRPDPPRLRPRKQRRLERDSDEADRQTLLAQAQQYAPDFVLPVIEIDAVSVHVVKLAAVLTSPRTMARLARIAIAAFESPIHITQEELGDQDLDGFIRRYEKDDVSVRRQQLMALVQRKLRVDIAQFCSRSITGGRKALQPGFVQELKQRFNCSYDKINSKRKEGQAVLHICRGHHGLLTLLPFHGSNMDINFACYADLRKEDTILLHHVLEKNNVRYLCAVGSAIIDFVFQSPGTPFKLNGREICLTGQGETNTVEKVTESMLAASSSPMMQCKCDVSRIDSPLATLF